MTALYTVNKSPLERNTFESCLRHAVDGAAILLIEDGVYGAMAACAPKIPRNIRLYALKPDVDARGIRDKILPDVTLVDYAEFVELAIRHSPVVAWL